MVFLFCLNLSPIINGGLVFVKKQKKKKKKKSNEKKTKNPPTHAPTRENDAGLTTITYQPALTKP
jgi:hypothetical protein